MHAVSLKLYASHNMNPALAVYDDPEEWGQFGHPDQPGKFVASEALTSLWTSHIRVEGMHCAACAGIVEHALVGVVGVRKAEVNAVTGYASVYWQPSIVKPSQWLQALDSAGYPAQPVSDTHNLSQIKQTQRMMLWRWLVAGFCMMQVMMYAMPAYVAIPGEMMPDQEALLRWASWVLTLPVLLFSCGPFFSNAWRDLRLRRISMDLPVVIGLSITFLISTFASFEPRGPWGTEVYFDSLTMFVFFLLTGRWLEQRLRARTAGALQALTQRLPSLVERVLADGQSESVPVRRLRAGDIIRVLPGQAFAADGTIMQGVTQVDEAILTGESTPVPRGVGEAAGCAVLAGSYTLSAEVLVRVDHLGQATRFAQIVALIDSAAIQKPRIAQLADRMAAPFLWLVLGAAVAAAMYQWYWGAPHDLPKALMVAVSVLIVTCPCALSLATPAAMLAAAGNLARQGVLVRNLQAIETLAQVSTVVFDKTGTLTTGKMRVTRVLTRAGVSETAVRAMASVVAKASLHPVSKALIQDNEADAAYVADQVNEKAGHGLEGSITVAATGDVMVLRLGSMSWCGVNANDRGGQSDSDNGSDGISGSDRVFDQKFVASDAARWVYLSDADGWLASFGLSEDLRSDALDAVTNLHSAGVGVQLLSGDQQSAAERVGDALGIQKVMAQRTPEQKLQYLLALQSHLKDGKEQVLHKVAMVGDGLNDGPVLAAADVSFAMGQAVPLAQAHADFVVQGEQLGAVANALLLSRRCVRIVRQNLLWALIYNMACIPIAIAGHLPAWLAGLGMAISSLVVVANAARLSITDKNRAKLFGKTALDFKIHDKSSKFL